MLKDYLLDWCQDEIDGSITGCCSKYCDNQEHCEHDCDRCLDQVHWYPSKPGRADYTCSNLLLRYVVRFTEKYSQQIASALTFIDHSRYPRYNILSIGCGGTPDLMAFEEVNTKPIYYKGYDRNPFWKEIHSKIEQYADGIDGLDVKLRQRDIFDVFSAGKPNSRQYNVVIIQYLLSHLYNTGQADKTLQLFESIIRNILARRLPNSPFLIIITDVDSMNKGRCNWHMLLDHYTAAVRRHIVGDDNIKKLCQDFYDRHKEVLDTIYENCKTSLNPICEVAEDWCREKSEQGELIFSPQWSNNTYTRFTTETIRKLFPQHTKPISGWKTTDMAFYEIIKRENYFKITLSLCSDNLTDEQRAACDRVSQALNRPDRKEDWRWKRIRNWPRHTIESEPNSENYKEEIYRYLNTNWREIQKFENDLLNKTE